MTFKEKMIAEFMKNGIEFRDEQIDQLSIYYDMLIEKNKVMNLTAITDEEEVIRKHFIDSLSCSSIIDMNNISKCIDIGTGAGFPGIPLKIFYPDTDFILVDSLGKRVKFLNDVTEALGLKGISSIHARAEDLGHDPSYRGRFDLCVSRAVAGLNVLSEYCIPFLKKDGYFIAYKSKKADEEIRQAQGSMKKIGWKVEETREFMLTPQGESRVLIKIKKIKKTPALYPRKAGIPSRKPLT